MNEMSTLQYAYIWQKLIQQHKVHEVHFKLIFLHITVWLLLDRVIKYIPVGIYLHKIELCGVSLVDV